MRRRNRIIIGVVLAVTGPGRVGAQDPAPAPAPPVAIDPARVVGRVLGRPVTAGDIKLAGPVPSGDFDARDDDRWSLMGRVVQELGGPITERFSAERRLAATPAEIALFRAAAKPGHEQTVRDYEAKLAEVDHALQAPGLAEAGRAALTGERATLTRGVASARDLVRDGTEEGFARAFIESWKFERELHRVYGGRVIFQQFGCEALDGRRRLFEEAERRGDLVFVDPDVRRLFYHDSNMPHTVLSGGDGPNPLEKRPWFFGPGPAPGPAPVPPAAAPVPKP